MWYGHSRTQKRGDSAVTAESVLMGSFEIVNVVDHTPRLGVVVDVKICATVSGSEWDRCLEGTG